MKPTRSGALERLPDSGRFVALDALRGFAAVGVVMLHSLAVNGIAQWPLFRNGRLFVDFFFVLSGFVIAASYRQRIASGFPLTRFLLLRLGRVYPLHIVMVAAFLTLEVLAALFGSLGINYRAPFTDEHSPVHLLRAILLADGYFPDFRNFYNGVSWSISVEIALYCLAGAAFRAGKAGMVAFSGIALIALASRFAGLDLPIWTDSIHRGLIGFVAGVCCWLLYERGVRPGGPATLLEVISIMLTLATIHFAVQLTPLLPLVALPFALTVWVFAAERGAVSRVLGTCFPVWLGTISYSIYMVHGFVLGRLYDLMHLVAVAGGPRLLQFRWEGDVRIKAVVLSPLASSAVTLLGVVIALAVAHLSWRWIEEPSRQWSRRKAKAFGSGAQERVASTL
jgi:peptidoglycan/LPS O-acetylase OafA/YrhL